jgi:adenylosuccinate synthase
MKTKNIFVDAVIGVSFGDEGKGKITHHLASGKGGKNYTHVMRTSGGNNAGHTIYHNGKKFATHMVPCGVFHGIKSVIGNGCVVNVEKLRKEVKMLEDGGVVVMPLLKIANNAHIITQSHVEEEMSESSVGTTKTGNGPAYRDKYARVGVRAETALIGTEFESCLVDLYEELYGDPLNPIRVLVEGAQGFYLDIDWGDYPYVTSSHCGVGGVMLNGFNHKHIDTVYGSAKCYETYVGAKEFEDKTDPVLPKIREIGGEYGVTCMPAGELILTSKGYINIENAKIGMSVITHNGRIRKITEILSHEAEPVYKVTLENGLTLRTNGKHPYLIANNWIKACDLTNGMEATVLSNKEEWRQVTKEGFSDYEISSWGRVKNSKSKYLLSATKSGLWGHLKVTLQNPILGKSRKSGGIKDFKIHSLVAEAFMGAKPDGMEVRHLNGIPWDNSVQNLVYGTPKENRADAVNHGSMSRRREGAHGGFKTTKLTEKDVAEIRKTPRRNARGWWRKTIPSGISDKTVALKYGVSRETIRDIRLNKCWQPESKTMLSEKTASFFRSKIALIEIEKEQPVFGVTVEEDESHVTGGIVTHNTGRARQVGYLNIDRLIKACEINGVDTLILNKVDVLRTANCWKTVRGMDIKNSVVTEHKDEESFKRYVEDRLSSVNVVWSDSPERI